MKLSPATKFWIGLGGYVLLADITLWRRRKDTMSIQFGSWLQTERGRKIAVTGWGILTAHLFYSVPLPGQTVLKRVVMNGKGETKPVVVETTYEVL